MKFKLIFTIIKLSEMHWAGKELIAFNQIKDFNIYFFYF